MEGQKLKNAYWLSDDAKEQIARTSRQAGIVDPYETVIVLRPEYTAYTGAKTGVPTAVKSGFKDVEEGENLPKRVRQRKREQPGH
jgi:hypothetical protein